MISTGELQCSLRPPGEYSSTRASPNFGGASNRKERVRGGAKRSGSYPNVGYEFVHDLTVFITRLSTFVMSLEMQAIAARLQSISVYSIFKLKGHNGNFGGENGVGVVLDVYVLTMPAFDWIKIIDGANVLNATVRRRQSYSMYHDRQILVLCARCPAWHGKRTSDSSDIAPWAYALRTF